ncbi:hypothetical protein UPYG_G00156510 [Umbra pygmaea]|uniref:Ig-like domain-containing protein n=1 Tax=Umbra pygmaea TaxID=75934 RepID=A0ABD0XN50_UMBPY
MRKSLKMKILVIVIILSGIMSTLAQDHDVSAVLECFGSDPPVILVTLDGNGAAYADKDNAQLTAPFLPKQMDTWLSRYRNFATEFKQWCEVIIKWGQQAVPSIPQVKDAPESSIYTRNDVQLGINNTLICFSNHFFPPSIKVRWTKNGMDVTEGVYVSHYYPNKDGTFYLFSTIHFTPQQGDIYACTVEHTALEEPNTRLWEAKGRKSSVGPNIICGVGLTLGVLGIATGTALLAKRNH